MSTRTATGIIAVFAASILILSIVFASDGVIHNDPERNIWIPDELLMDLKAKAAYDGENIYWRFEWEAPVGDFYHDYLVYQNGEWTRYGRSPIGTDPFRTYEDRLTFFVDDGSVPFFAQYGGFLTVSGDQMRFFTDMAGSDEVQQHIGQDDLRKWLPETRTDFRDWRTLRPDDELEALTDAGYFLDLWHWRAHRSNPIGYSDDQHVSWYRLGDAGRSPYATNWNGDAGHPTYMFDPEQTGQYAMSWDRVLDMDYTQDDFYYLSEEIAVPFDPDREWQEGDVIPRRLLREPAGSRGAIFANGVWQDGVWRVDLTRALDTGSPRDDKIFQHMSTYDMAFAVHRDATGSRWHYVSMPVTLGLSRDADIVAQRFDGDQPPWDTISWSEMTLFYPGQIAWDHLMSEAHAGYDQMQQKASFYSAHTEEDIALYAIEGEFRNEIRTQWRLTTLAWAFFFLTASWAVIRIADTDNAGKGRN